MKVNQKVEVTVLAVDAERKRISLSMKKGPKEKTATEKNDRPDPSNAVERKIPPGKPPRGNEKKRDRGKEAPKPFNNPFAEALRRR